jgi:DNA repair protein RadA/Sms
MSKVKTLSVRIVAQYAKWQGQCNSCKEWNTIAEEKYPKQEKSSLKSETTVTSKVPSL